VGFHRHSKTGSLQIHAVQELHGYLAARWHGIVNLGVTKANLLPWETELVGYNSLMTILEGSKFGYHHELLLAV
jgi:hypothetical protein